MVTTLPVEEYLFIKVVGTNKGILFKCVVSVLERLSLYSNKRSKIIRIGLTEGLSDHVNKGTITSSGRHYLGQKLGFNVSITPRSPLKV